MSHPESSADDYANNTSPPNGYDWGERTTQTRKHAPEYWRPDAYEMRMKYGIGELDIDGEFRDHELTDLTWPDIIVHENDVTRTNHPPGGRPVLTQGKRGSGKTTLYLHASIRILDENDDIVIWRGSQDRSGWLPLRHWATVWLPSSVDYSAAWMEEISEAESERIGDADLDDVVRSVRRYDSVQDLLTKLGDVPAGTFHVVYPDPGFNGCNQVVRESGRTSQDLPFNPAWDPGDAGETPLIHWWFPFQIHRLEHGPYRWMTLMFDEARQFTPGGQQMRQDDQLSRSKVDWLCDALTDSRRAQFSPWYANHKKHHMLWDLRAEFNYRINMPDGTRSPHRNGGWIPAGMESVPMTKDLMQDANPGRGLAYSESDRSWFTWNDIKDRDSISGKKLQIELGGY